MGKAALKFCFLQQSPQMWEVGWSEVVGGMGKTWFKEPRFEFGRRDLSCVKAVAADGALRHVAFSFF